MLLLLVLLNILQASTFIEYWKTINHRASSLKKARAQNLDKITIDRIIDRKRSI